MSLLLLPRCWVVFCSFATSRTVARQAPLSMDYPRWVAISSSRESSRPRDQTLIFCIGRRILYHWATREALKTKYTHTHINTSETREIWIRLTGCINAITSKFQCVFSKDIFLHNHSIKIIIRKFHLYIIRYDPLNPHSVCKFHQFFPF